MSALELRIRCSKNSTVLLIRPRVTFRPIYQDPDPPERPDACLQMYVKLVIDEIIPYAPNALQRPSWTVATMPSNIHVTIDTWDLIPLPGVPGWDHHSETQRRAIERIDYLNRLLELPAHHPGDNEVRPLLADLVYLEPPLARTRGYPAVYVVAPEPVDVCGSYLKLSSFLEEASSLFRMFPTSSLYYQGGAGMPRVRMSRGMIRNVANHPWRIIWHVSIYNQITRFAWV